MTQATQLKLFYMEWLVPIFSWLKELTRGETLMLIATLCFGAVGAYGTFLFYEPSRGPIVGALAASGIELLYIGAAGAAVKSASRRWLAYSLMFIGSAGSAYYGVMVSLKEAMPGMFATPVVWPSTDQWIVFGVPSLVEGIVPALAALLLSVFLHSSVSGRLVEADDKAKQIQQRKEMRPFGCPFCPAAFDSPAKLYGHGPRCDSAKESDLSADERRAIVAKAVAEGKQRILEG
jgi:hypothetical protein